MATAPRAWPRSTRTPGARGSAAALGPGCWRPLPAAAHKAAHAGRPLRSREADRLQRPARHRPDLARRRPTTSGRKTDPTVPRHGALEGGRGRPAATEPSWTLARLEAALAALEGVTPEDARRAARPAHLRHGRRPYGAGAHRRPTTSTTTISLSDRARRLTQRRGRGGRGHPQPRRGARRLRARQQPLRGGPGPSGRGAARSPATARREVLNGKLDWVYQEEIYGRGHLPRLLVEPRLERLAFLRLDEKGVPRYTLVDDIPYHPEVEV